MAFDQASAIVNVQTIIRHQIDDRSLLVEALQAAGSNVRFAGSRAIPDGNKRLALLGDTVLRLALLDQWIQGETSRGTGDAIIQRVVCNSNLATIGRQNGLSAFVNGNPSQPGFVSDKMLATAVEAIIGAVYCDSGKNIEAVKFIMRALGFELI